MYLLWTKEGKGCQTPETAEGESKGREHEEQVWWRVVMAKAKSSSAVVPQSISMSRILTALEESESSQSTPRLVLRHSVTA